MVSFLQGLLSSFLVVNTIYLRSLACGDFVKLESHQEITQYGLDPSQTYRVCDVKMNKNE